MKEVIQQTGLNPEEFCGKVPFFPGHIKGDLPLTNSLANEKYQTALSANLTHYQIDYINLLLSQLSIKYPIVSYLRVAIKNKTIFMPEDKDTKFDESTRADLVILERIFTPRPLLSPHEKAFWPVY